MTDSTYTVFELVDEIIAPLTGAVPQRASPMEFYDPDFSLPAALLERPPPQAEADLVAEAEQYTKVVSDMAAMGLLPDGEVTPAGIGLYRALRGGFVRGVITGVFDLRTEPLQVRFFGDDEYATVMSIVGGEVTLRSGGLGGLARWALDEVPDIPPGPGEFVELHADERGILPRAGAADLATIRACAARKRRGTVLVDLTVRNKIIAEHPRGAVVLVDTDVGRYFVGTSVHSRGHWVLQFAPATREHVEEWIEWEAQYRVVAR